jgi:uncharacterized protein (DUF952 family)
MALIFKILDATLWAVTKEHNTFKGAAIDLKDGYIHFSTAAQMHETAKLHFAGQDNLVLFAVEAETVAHKLKWEASRGGKLFPHVYGTIDLTEVLWAKPLPWNGTQHLFPVEANA